MSLLERSKFLLKVIKRYATLDDTTLEIGCGDYRNVNYLKEHGYNVEGIDKIYGTSIQEFAPKEYDIIFTMSTLFLINDDSIFPKIANMAKKFIITIEGETTKEGNGVIGRDYNEIFSKLGFTQVESEKEVFNIFGVMRVFKKI